MSSGVVGLSFTGSSALGDVERTLLEDTNTEVTGCLLVKGLSTQTLFVNLRIFTLAVKRSVDSGIAEVDGSSATRRSNDLVGDIAVRASNDYVEIFTPLSGVLCILPINRSAPEHAFYVRGAGRVGAALVVGVDGGIALVVKIESGTALDGITLRGTNVRGVFGKDSVSHVAISIVAGLQVLESVVVSAGGGCSVGLSGEFRVGQESFRGVLLGDRASTERLRLADGSSTSLETSGSIGNNTRGLDRCSDGSGSGRRLIGNSASLSTDIDNWDGDSGNRSKCINGSPVNLLRERVGYSQSCKGSSNGERAHIGV